MSISKFMFTSLGGLAVSLTTACAANSADVATDKVARAYAKPGASVSYSHTLKSQVNAGETTTFRLFMDEPYPEGRLSVTLSADGEISLFPSSTEASFDMSQGNSHEMLVSFTPQSNGRHYINVQAMATNPAGQSQPRIFSLPVQVGPLTAQKPNADMKIMQNGDNIIEMTAEEEIK